MRENLLEVRPPLAPSQETHGVTAVAGGDPSHAHVWTVDGGHTLMVSAKTVVENLNFWYSGGCDIIVVYLCKDDAAFVVCPFYMKYSFE